MNIRKIQHDIFSSFDTVTEGVELLRSLIDVKDQKQLAEIEDILGVILLQASRGKNNFNDFLKYQEEVL